MLVHGLADDNVYAVHTLELSSALLVAPAAPFRPAPARGDPRGGGRRRRPRASCWAQVDFFRAALAAPAPA